MLVVAAHPDDAEYSVSGTAAMWTDAGIEVAYCIVTYGEAGGFDDASRSSVPALREAEQRAAAAAVGVGEVTVLGFPDGAVVTGRELRLALTREIRRMRPQLVVSHSPHRNWDYVYASHPDHLATGEATLGAVYPDARNPFAYPELTADEHPAWTVSQVWLTGAPRHELNHVVDITSVFDRKILALRAHASQVGHLADLDERVRARASAMAANGNLADGRLAESFHVVRV